MIAEDFARETGLMSHQLRESEREGARKWVCCVVPFAFGWLFCFGSHFSSLQTQCYVVAGMCLMNVVWTLEQMVTSWTWVE